MGVTAAAENRGDPAYRRGLALVLLAGTLWSTVGIVVRLMEEADEWQILFYRSLGLTLFLSLALTLKTGGRPLALFRRAGPTAVFGGFGLVLAFGGSIISLVNTTVANAMFLFASAPFLAAVLGRLVLGESVRPATWIALAFALAGVGIMVVEGFALGHAFGNLAALVSALGFALFTVALRWPRSGRSGVESDDHRLTAVCYGGLFMTVLAALMCLVEGRGFAVSSHDAILALGLGVIQLGLGLSVYTLGARSVPAVQLALLSMTEVLFGPLWVWLFLGEEAGALTLVGGVLLLGAIAGNALSGLRRRPPPIGPL